MPCNREKNKHTTANETKGRQIMEGRDNRVIGTRIPYTSKTNKQNRNENATKRGGDPRAGGTAGARWDGDHTAVPNKTLERDWTDRSFKSAPPLITSRLKLNEL